MTQITASTTDIVLDLTLPWQVVTDNVRPPVQLAIRELQSHWQPIAGQPLSVATEKGQGNFIVLSVAGQGGDGFTWHAQPQQITGASARGLLFGVYYFLEALGCRWLAPGALWTRKPI